MSVICPPIIFSFSRSLPQMASSGSKLLDFRVILSVDVKSRWFPQQTRFFPQIECLAKSFAAFRSVGQDSIGVQFAFSSLGVKHVSKKGVLCYACLKIYFNYTYHQNELC